jgi:phosphatidylserine/phosphatidylglycerophosphate/cardiolipin synthase-like enzyme
MKEFALRGLLERIFFAFIFFMLTLVGLGIAWEIRLWSDPGEYARRLLIDEHDVIHKALFAPDDDIKQVLLGLIQQEKQAILIAAFSFTDTDLALALIDAHKRGVTITIVMERSNSEGHYSKIPQLRSTGINLFLYPKVAELSKAAAPGIMHNKFMVFSDTINHKAVLWTGSFNFTKSASQINQENVLIVDDPSLIQAYQNHFDILEQRCDQVSGVTCVPRSRPGTTVKKNFSLDGIIRNVGKVFGV